jgi:hypothetical protein
MNGQMILIMLGAVLGLAAHAAISRQLDQTKRKPDDSATDVPPIGGEESGLDGEPEVKGAVE